MVVYNVDYTVRFGFFPSVRTGMNGSLATNRSQKLHICIFIAK